ncbi:hypothetical protein CDAR_247131 [Caerostris darwini]|uniref:Uncharacterized protein n=1 Tax=Caerostris darwini TaxID=1538125 RepID=A0AAV4SKN4_9ARAC|nr:hypothetical protein CDAR_247131 [Caerostris darwini]
MLTVTVSTERYTAGMPHSKFYPNSSIQFRNAKPLWLSPNPSSPNRTCRFSGPHSLEHLEERRELVPFNLGEYDYGLIEELNCNQSNRHDQMILYRLYL